MAERPNTRIIACASANLIRENGSLDSAGRPGTQCADLQQLISGALESCYVIDHRQPASDILAFVGKVPTLNQDAVSSGAPSALVTSDVVENVKSTTQGHKLSKVGSRTEATQALANLLKRDRRAIAASWASRHLKRDEIRTFVDRLAGEQNALAFYRDTYLNPLLVLLHGAVTGKKPAWRAVYLDERTRFLVPAVLHLTAHEERLEELLAADIGDLVSRLKVRHRITASEVLKTLHLPLQRKAKRPPVRLLLIGDCVMTELRAFLSGGSQEPQTDLQIRHQYFSFKRGLGLSMPDVMEHINSGSTDLVAMNFFAFEGVPLYRALLANSKRLSQLEKQERATDIVRIVCDAVAEVRASSDVPILLHNASGLRLSNWRRRLAFVAPIPRSKLDVIALINRELVELVKRTENTVLIDEYALARSYGLRRASKNLIPRRLRKRALFNTSAFGPVLAREYVPIVSAYERLRRTKVLFIDFDNTLWKGVMAEGKVRQYNNEQRLLRKLREAGILLVALSKNDSKLIRWDEMYLQTDDFALLKISWNQKVQSINEAAQQLGLGRDSFTVIDDNPAERALIKERYPEVALLDPTLPETWRAVELLLSFPNTRETEESAARTALYRAAAERNEAMTAPLDYPVMMKTLDLRATWSQAQPKQLKRVHELLLRTNQFNTTTKRRTFAELRALLANESYRVFACSLTDQFGDLGIVSVVILEIREDAVVFDAVVMSCRAMGFGLESLLIRAPLDHMLSEAGVRLPVQGLFYRTDKNEPAATIFKDCGFTLSEDCQWQLLPNEPLPEVAEWLTVSIRTFPAIN